MIQGNNAIATRLNIHNWIEFFLLHESHRLFNILQLKGAIFNPII